MPFWALYFGVWRPEGLVAVHEINELFCLWNLKPHGVKRDALVLLKAFSYSPRPSHHTMQQVRKQQLSYFWLMLNKKLKKKKNKKVGKNKLQNNMSVNGAMVENCKKLKIRFPDTFDDAHFHTDGKIHDRILLYPEKTDLEVHVCTHIHAQMRKGHFLWTFRCSVMACLWYQRSHAVMQKWLEPPLSFLHTSLQQYSKLYYPPTAPCQYPTASLLLQSGPWGVIAVAGGLKHGPGSPQHGSFNFTVS